MGLDPHCGTAQDALSGLPLFDADAQTCNTLTESVMSASLVAEQREPYIGQVCAGIASDYSVPPPSALDPHFAPLLPPFVLQSVTETALAEVERLIPRYLTEDCLVAQRALVCSSYFLQPFPSDALSFVSH
jgi:hypothetical protein